MCPNECNRKGYIGEKIHVAKRFLVILQPFRRCLCVPCFVCGFVVYVFVLFCVVVRFVLFLVG